MVNIIKISENSGRSFSGSSVKLWSFIVFIEYDIGSPESSSINLIELLAFKSFRLSPSLFRIGSENSITIFEFVAISIDPLLGEIDCKNGGN